MERQYLRLRTIFICLAVALSVACGPSSSPSLENLDTDTVDPETIAPEGDIVGSGFW